VIDGEIRLAYPVAELSEVVANARRKEESTVNLSPPHAIEMTALINHRLRGGEDPQWRQLGLPAQQVVERVYWQVGLATFAGVLDSVRTTLVELVAEMRAGIAVGESLPSPAVAEQAFSVAVRGNRNRVIIQRPGPGSIRSRYDRPGCGQRWPHDRA
jgi:hypothetical protein